MENCRQKKFKKSKIIYLYLVKNFEKYLQETTLHGLKYLADSKLSSWEKLFFFASFVAAFTTVVNLISNVYSVWDSTPVIIGINPHPTSIINVPFPALTLCNLNQVLKSKVANYSRNSLESDILEYLCLTEEEYKDLIKSGKTKDNNLTVADFLIKVVHTVGLM